MSVTDDEVKVSLEDKRKTSRCPCCGKRSSRVHSYYTRQMLGLPMCGRKVSVEVTARKYRCENKKCSRKIFAAQIEGVTERHSRFTEAARKYLEQTLVYVPSTTGSEQSRLSGLHISTSTALRIVKRTVPQIDYASIRSICIDDFAFRKGQSYRTLIVDADSGLPVEVICSRDIEDVEKALKKYKHVRTVSRDRGGVYAKAAGKSLPGAKQVADRFHLVMNCGEHVGDAFKHNIRTIRQEVEKHLSSHSRKEADSLFQPATLEDVELFTKVKALRIRKWSLERIASEVGSTRRKVTEICNSEAPHGKKIMAPRKILPYMDIIEQGIAVGDGYKEIYKKILNTGGKMTYKALRLGMKKMHPLYKPSRGYNKRIEKNKSAAENAGKSETKLLTCGRMHIYLMNPEYGVDRHTGECTKEHSAAETLIASSVTLLQLRNCHLSFRNILKGDSTAALDEWIATYSKSEFPDITSFVKSVQRDIKSIKNAIRYPISNGLIEGLNNKIKAIKRSMYGRASDNLLWIKMYHTGRQLQHQN